MSFLTLSLRHLTAIVLFLALSPIVPGAVQKKVVLQHKFNHSTEGWITPSHWKWNGKTERTANGTMLLSATQRSAGKEFWGRSYTVSNADNVRGMKLELSCKVRGNGKVRLGAMYRVLGQGKSKWHYSDYLQLTDKWQLLQLTMDFSQLDVNSYWMMLDLTGKGQVEYDDMTVKKIFDPDQTSIKGPARILRHVENTPFADIVYQTGEPERDFAVFAGNGDEPVPPVMLKSDEKGKLTVPGKLIKKRRDGRALVTVARNGVTASTDIELITPEEYEKLFKRSEKIKFDRQPHTAAVIADSLWDFDRGMNCADELNFWLNKHYPGQFKIHNFAVAGDSIASVERRFNQQEIASKWVTYKPMLAKSFNPDTVFIQLGHNDTRAFCGDNFAAPLIDPVLQEACFDRLLKNLRRMWPQARIILITPMANDTEYMAAKAARELKKSKRVWRFGDIDKVTAYIQTLHKIAARHKLEVMDVFTPMSKIADRKNMFRKDGVHLLRSGYRYLAGEIMAYLDTKPQPPAVQAFPEALPYRGKFVLQNAVIKKSGEMAPQIFRSSDGKRQLLGFGNLTHAPDKTLRFDGKTSGLALDDSQTLDPNKGLTFSITIKNRSLLTDNHLKRIFSGYFFKHQQILFCRKDRQLYFNFFADNDWRGDLYSGDVFVEEPGHEEFHHAALTVRHHYVRSQGENWIEAKLYFDGELVAQKQYPNARIADSRFPLEIGTGSSLSNVWHSKADIAEVELFDRALSDDQIETLFNQQKMIKHKRSATATAAAEKYIDQLSAAAHYRSALKNLARSGIAVEELKKYSANMEKYFTVMPGKESILTLFIQPEKVRIVSWFDLKTQRELINFDAAFFSVEGLRNKKKIKLSPLHNSVKNFLSAAPEKQQGSWHFTIKTQLDGDAYAQTVYKFSNDRLEFKTSLNTDNSNLALNSLNLPDLRLRPLQSPHDRLLVPIMSGVEYPSASRLGAHYSETYPRGAASMQLGAYYDNQTGIYWTLLDNIAGYKKLKFEAGRKRVNVLVNWPVPGPENSPVKKFTPNGAAVIELFRGNWYDAGLLYRRDLENMQALWWRKNLPNSDTPEWLRKNSLMIRRLVNSENEVEPFKLLSEFLEDKFLIEWAHCSCSNQYSPLMRMESDTVAWIRDMHKLGLRTIPYTDPRLWQVFDRRDEDFMFSKKAKAHCIVENGKLLIEYYENRACGVTCAVSEYIQQMMQQMMFNLVNIGFDGIYADQVGAARPHLCEVASHGHAVRDGEAHFRDGWLPMFTKVRKEWKKSAPDAVLITEDNAEHCVGMMDAMLPWRWMYEHQVPLYPMVYAGRTQFVGREPDCEEPRAIYPKAAIQAVNSEQLGYIEHQLATSPLRNSYRVFLKQLIYLRRAMLDFFNCGMMARPVKFAQAWPREKLVWGVRGTGSVTSEAVVSSAWSNDNIIAIMLVNHTPEVQKNTLFYDLPSEKNQVYIYSSTQTEVIRRTSSRKLELALNMPPRSCMMIIAADSGKNLDKLLQNTAECFKVIVKAPETPDPFKLDELKMHSRNAGAATDWHHARDAADTAGCRQDVPRNEINWIRDAVVSVGEVDFGDGGAETLEATFSAPPRSGLGITSFYTDSLAPENKFAEFLFDQKCFLTGSWRSFEARRQKISRKITGKHRVFIKFEGSSFCNMQSWRMK